MEIKNGWPATERGPMRSWPRSPQLPREAALPGGVAGWRKGLGTGVLASSSVHPSSGAVTPSSFVPAHPFSVPAAALHGRPPAKCYFR